MRTQPEGMWASASQEESSRKETNQLAPHRELPVSKTAEKKKNLLFNPPDCAILLCQPEQTKT